MKRSLVSIAVILILPTILAILSLLGVFHFDTHELSAEPGIVEEVPVAKIKENSQAGFDTKPENEAVFYTEEEVVMMAKLLYQECRGVPSDTEKACVAWTVCNRVDSESFPGSTVEEVMTERNQFAYDCDAPVWDGLYDLAMDVLSRWSAERNGELAVGRVLPKDYTYYTGDGTHNYFRNGYKETYDIWDYSLPSPYES